MQEERGINLCMAEVRESSHNVTQLLHFTPTWDLPIVLLGAVCRSPVSDETLALLSITIGSEYPSEYKVEVEK